MFPLTTHDQHHTDDLLDKSGLIHDQHCLNPSSILFDQNYNFLPPSSTPTLFTSNVNFCEVLYSSNPTTTLVPPSCCPLNTPTTITSMSSTRHKTIKVIRDGRKDRHSKIITATGLRDRRMRLSLEVARKFFDLQDMLGFDKASQTVQWLLTMSGGAIKELFPSSSGGIVSPESELSILTPKPDKKKIKKVCPKTKTPAETPRAKLVDSMLAKELRVKARERARKRTREKKSMSTSTVASSISVPSSGCNASSNSMKEFDDLGSEEIFSLLEYQECMNLLDEMELAVAAHTIPKM